MTTMQYLVSAVILSACLNVAFAQIDGNWGSWQSWATCSVTCGGSGTTSRTRNCDNPAPSNGGLPCNGSDTESLSCLIMNYCIPSYYGNEDLSCGANFFGCASGVVSCINMTQRCDMNTDCEDGSDENPYYTGCSTIECSKSSSYVVQPSLVTNVLLVVMAFIVKSVK